MKPYYERNGITIYCGDCLEIMPILEPPFDAIIADWPYGTTACSWDSVIPLEPLWKECKRLSDTAILFGAQPFTSKLIISNLDWFKYCLVWEKTNAGDFMLAQKRPRMLHEDICIFGNGATIYNPQMESGKPYVDKPRKRTHRIVNSSMPKLGIENRGTRYPSSIQKFSNGNNKIDHPAQKPEPLMAYLVRTYTKPGDLILDNTMGSGTTLLAAQNESRRAVGIEISEEYCQVAVERLRQPSFWSLPSTPGDDKRQRSMFDVIGE
jgi:DNA modification methylase